MKKAFFIGLLIIGLYPLASYEKATLDPTEYYWFDANTGEYLHQNTIEDEMWFTEYNEGTYLPKTLREYGYAPSSVIIAPPADPEPALPWPDKVLYSHP